MSKMVEFNRNRFDWSTVQEQRDAAGNLVPFIVPAEVMQKLVEDRQRYWDCFNSLSFQTFPPPTKEELLEMEKNSEDINDLIRDLEDSSAKPEVAETKP